MRTNRLLTLSITTLCTAPLIAQIAEVQLGWYQTNGTVRAVAEDTLTNTLYVGGEFTTAVPPKPVPYGAALSLANGVPWSGFPSLDGSVWASVADGSGGVYIGGGFSHVGGVARSRLAHVNSDGSLAAWAPSLTGGTISTLILKGDTVIIGGTFGLVNGVIRQNLAMVHRLTGALFAFSATFSGTQPSVEALAVQNDTLVVGGNFFNMMGSPRSHLASVSLTTGALLPWNPNASALIACMTIHAGILYIGGSFTTIVGQPRSRFAGIQLSTGALMAINPGADDVVFALAVYGGQIYVAGAFTVFAGQTRNRLARIGLDYVVGSWAPVVNNTIFDMVVSNDVVYIAGSFTAVNGFTRNRIAAVGVPGTAQPATLPWDPNADQGLRTLSIMGGRLFAGGDYTTIGVFMRNGLLALDGTTGEPLAWNPGCDGIVKSFAIGNNAVYVGGQFTHLGTNAALRNNIGAVNLTDGLATAWNPNADAAVNDIVLSGTSVVLGGNFTSLGSIQRFGLSAVDAGTGFVTGWNASTGGPGQVVEQLIKSNDTLYVCGNFNTLNGITRGSLASILLPGPLGGLVTSFAPLPNGPVHTMAKQGNVIYASGSFTTIGGAGGQSYVSAVNATTGANTFWDPLATTAEYGVAASARSVYFLATKPDMNGVSTYGVHGFERSNAAQTGFTIALNNYTLVTKVLKNGSLFLGGVFSTAGGVARQGFAVVRDLPAILLNALLGGAVATTPPFLMSDALRAQGLLPDTEPYTALGYAHTGGGGGENAWDSIPLLGGNNAAVDWVVVELRNALDPSSVVASRSAFLQRDGDLMDAQGKPMMSFAPDPNASYYVAIRHRNHLGVMSASPLNLKFGVRLRFSDPATPTYGTNARKDLGGTMALWSGDVNMDGTIKYTGSNNDRDLVLMGIGGAVPTNTVSGYRREDVNMDGVVKYTGSGNDRDPILVNIGGTVPTTTRIAQLP